MQPKDKSSPLVNEAFQAAKLAVEIQVKVWEALLSNGNQGLLEKIGKKGN